MENNKKKALIKSVAAFTFAVSMFAAQSPAASAADVSAAGMLGHQIAHGESEESDEADETVDTTGDGDDDVNTNEDAVADEAAEAVGAETENTAAVTEASAPTEEAEAEADVDENIPDEEAAAPAEEDNGTETAVNEAAPIEENVVEATGAASTETPAPEAAAENTEGSDVADETDAEAYAEEVRSILGGANGYNVFVEGNYTQTGKNNIDVGDGSGVVAVGGNVDVGEGINHKGSSFEVGGSVTGTLQGDRVAVGEDCSVDFKTTFDELRATSSAISNVNGTTVSNGSDSSYIRSEYGTITLKGSDSDVNVFNMTVEEFNAMKTSDSMAIRYDVPEGSTVILNIVGEGDVNLVFDWGAYYNGGSLTSGNKEGNSKVMINVPGGNNVTIASGVGSLLAPSSSVGSGADRGYNPHYEGQVICKEFNGNIEFGSSSFDYTIKDKPVTPDTPDDDTPEDNTPDDNTPDDDTPEDNTPDDNTPDDDTPEDNTPDDNTPDDDTPEDNTPDDNTPDDDTPEDNTPDDNTPDDDTPEDNTPDDNTPDDDTSEDNTPDDDTPDDDTPEDNTPDDDTPDVPNIPDAPSIPNVSVTPDTPNFPVSPITPIIDFEMFDETEVPLAISPIQEIEESSAETINKDSETDSFETFDDAPVPLADDPFSDTDADSYSVNPKTGVDMTVPMGAAAAAMASFMALMIANRKRHGENN